VIFGKRKRTFAGQRRRNALLNHRLLLAGAAVAVAALFVLGQFSEGGVASWWKLRAEQAKLEAEVAELEAANQEIEADLEALASDPEALEKLAREQHSMHRKDEEVLMVLDRTGTDEEGQN
jgi:cell division protein FtsB